MSKSNLIKRDLASLWHPGARARGYDTLPPIPIRSAEGVWLEDFEGRRYVDAISCGGINLFGHSNPRLAAAVQSSLSTLQQIPFTSLSHAPAIELAERLCALAPEGLNHCRLSDNRASAIVAALRISANFWVKSGQPKKQKFVTMERSFPTRGLDPMSPEMLYVPSPDAFLCDVSESHETWARRQFLPMDELLAREHSEIAAVIIEPLVQFGAGIRMYDPIYMTLLREACNRHDVHLIIDDTTMGLGRTGKMFACEHAEISPDLLCLCNGLGGGYASVSAVLGNDSIYQGIFTAKEEPFTLAHPNRDSGNALACSAALATLDIFAEDNVLQTNQELVNRLTEVTQPFNDHPNIGEVRQTGMLLAIEVVEDNVSNTPYPTEQRRGHRIFEYALKQGVLLQPIGDVIYFMPPYVMAPEQIEIIAEVVWQGLELATATN
ncbi:MAG TPA: aminotransferase class III-fold pyridoxal phosphate-dependent enzyme [Chromatiaceae bacterium]|jgi:adenosylmethionine-8-amino-7-oxononanoate aminotransferase|nr:aminotransferase class III-fold pyridoxal phosphate-dependent enzyme [Chromatiaceae bacterium]HIN82267.1 aminotransferase class III-fold pyridoxal phosphate-dependent enzyme [Chromatiales bacterium]HIA08161.1 aminotransferase class III-fold pyridoxal phosphate-dependent enzyme [Chromatiaceae bacterium]HIB83143.1 aminotransferase class III-fold pyridoxal phosphate-dependent enzyme [Chromatiaceae bacterium]HIO13980.1 aminotransferase class III-fold pyridoxal phosphate-dependent enzyme [Chromat